MKGRISGNLLCAVLADANTVQSALANWVTNRGDRWNVEGGLPSVPPRHASTDPWRVVFDLAFNTQASMGALRDEAVDRWTSGGLATLIQTGSKIRLHLCRHDEGVPTCVVIDERVK